MVYKRVAVYVIALVSMTISACSSTSRQVGDIAHIEANNSNPSIVILGRRHIGHNETEVDYVSCVGEEIAERSQTVNVVPEQQFIDVMFPYFEESTAPLSVKHFAQLVQNPVLKQKIDQLNLHYVVWIDGRTRKVDQFGGVSCAIGPGGGGCLGFTSWDEEADYQAKVWDVQRLSLSKKISTERSGTSYMPAIIVPIPLLANVQDTACSDMARRIEQSFDI